MISGSLSGKKPLKQKSHYQKNEIISENQSKQCNSMAESVFSRKSKIKARVEREKASVKDQLQKFAFVKRNEVRKESSDNDSSQVFSKTNTAKIKISLKKCNEYFSKVNQNGFSTFPPLSQVVCPLFVILIIVEIEVMAFDVMEHLHALIITGVAVLLLLPTSYFWWVTTKIVPTDSIQLQHLDYIRNPAQSQFNPEKHKYFCNLCKTCISHRSFHCNRCNRCVQYFDHHCKWLNNCIGSKNYVQFLQLIIWSELFLVFFFVVNAILTNKIVNENDLVPALLWFGVAVMALSIVPFIALSILLCLHLYLVIAKRTTLELILQNRKKNKIHPHHSGDVLTQKKPSMLPLPEESPINSPTLVGVENNTLLKDMNQQNNESLIKFMANLTKSLRLSKKGSNDKSVDKNEKDEVSEIEERKINFKPTILKKTTCIVRNQAKSNTEKTNKVFIEESKNQDSKRSDRKNQSIKDQLVDSDESEMDETAKNFVSRLKFSTKNEIIEDSTDEVKTSPKSQKGRKVQTQRVKSIQRRETAPRRLQPLKGNQTQRKIKFQAKVETFGKENLKKEAETKEFSIDEECKQTSKKKSKSKKRNESQEEVQKSKAKSTRLFKVVSAENKGLD